VETVVEFQETSFPGSGKSDKKIHCCSGRMLIIIDGSQQNLRCFYRKSVKRKKEFPVISVPHNTRYTKQVAFLFQ